MSAQQLTEVNAGNGIEDAAKSGPSGRMAPEWVADP